MKFQKDNKIFYYQDHGWGIGLPDNVDFEIEKANSNGIWLRGPGYGQPQNYGNGGIAVYFQTKNDIDNSKKIKELDKGINILGRNSLSDLKRDIRQEVFLMEKEGLIKEDNILSTIGIISIILDRLEEQYEKEEKD